MTARRYERGIAVAAILAAMALHFLLAWCVLRHRVVAPPAQHVISVTLVRPLAPPPEFPKPRAKPKATASAPPLSKPIPHAAPGPAIQAKPKAHVPVARPAPPVAHFGSSGATAGLGLDLGTPSGGGSSGHGSIGDFEDAVKQRIEAAKTYPPGIHYMWNECVVEYQVTVNRAGQLLHYKLYGCGDPFLDSAARAAILKASPFPVPPDFGGAQYTVFGSLVFKHH